MKDEVGIVGAALVRVVRVQMRVHFLAQRFGQTGMIQECVRESGGQVDLNRLRLGKVVEHFIRQRAGAMLDRAAGTMKAGALAQVSQRIEIHSHLGLAAVRQQNTAVGCARCHTDLAQPGVIAQFAQRSLVAVNIRVQLRYRRVLFADFADLAAQADGDALRLQVADELGEHGRAQVVFPLLLVQRWRRQRHQGARIDIDVPVAGCHRLLCQRFHLVHRAFRVVLILLAVHLKMVALNEDWPPVPLFNGPGDEDSRKLGRFLERVTHLAARDLKNERAGLRTLRRAEGRPPRLVRRKPHIHRRYSAVRPRIRPPGNVKLVNARRARAHQLAQFPD